VSHLHPSPPGGPPQPGDVLVEPDGDRSLVVAVEVIKAGSRLVPAGSCSCCHKEWPSEDLVKVWVAQDEPVEVITVGGGKARVVGLTEWWGNLVETKMLRVRE